MCGRYYVDDETEKEIHKKIPGPDLQIRIEQAGDVCPARRAAVIKGCGQRLAGDEMVWGFPKADGKGLLINARAESALEKKTWRESIRHRRCVIPARGFYEWTGDRRKFFYEREDSPVLFMAGCYNSRNQFVILTTKANPSVSPVHARMPLILDPEEIENWILDDRATEYILQKTPVMLKAGEEYEQLSLF